MVGEGNTECGGVGEVVNARGGGRCVAKAAVVGNGRLGEGVKACSVGGAAVMRGRREVSYIHSSKSRKKVFRMSQAHRRC